MESSPTSIVPASLLREAFVGSTANPDYGLTFWLNSQAPAGAEIDVEKEIDLPWERVLFTFGDERCVPPDDEQSNYRMARESLFERARVPDQLPQFGGRKMHLLGCRGSDCAPTAGRRRRARVPV